MISRVNYVDLAPSPFRGLCMVAPAASIRRRVLR
jgi:hypothetical protein